MGETCSTCKIQSAHKTEIVHTGSELSDEADPQLVKKSEKEIVAETLSSNSAKKDCSSRWSSKQPTMELRYTSSCRDL